MAGDLSRSDLLLQMMGELLARLNENAQMQPFESRGGLRIVRSSKTSSS